MSMYSEASLVFAWMPIFMAFILGVVARIIQARYYEVRKHVGGHTERIYKGNGKFIPVLFLIINTTAILLLLEAVLYTLFIRLIINQ